ncbi:lichenicidin A2 family type 2 lantibiotic [Staphylococcus agnetis]|uniref:lichenicidin A2 family type 2 lantibiotic n=1 Tax=Staphylococcus agnetis TaxID=985762 RepID=UPI00208E2BE3|nr:lichenicidin A2 family type 2 lantibiotic [Staphylococcus agnetis]MCO4327807.1 lichenicidin A2 family type 2 lantibiotic [Staphylococcus agnetis]MCO4353492.1 lichenicidin A2 family type 2 lantibiotic [Staphylococcus agnetis]MCO4370188.1 lichenicidin A2 family type 2 lantibiotic [Staphylococcus agnetis]
MFENKQEDYLVPSFEDLSFNEMKALQEDSNVEAEISPTTTSSAFCVGAGVGLFASAVKC